MNEDKQAESGYPKPEYTQTPNLLFDKHMAQMSEVELKVVMCAIRQTLGWHKTHDPISLTQFQHMTGLSRQGVLDGIERAIERGVIEQIGTAARGTAVYQLRFYSTGQQNGLVNNLDQSIIQTRTGQEFRPELVKNLDTQKKERKVKKKESPAIAGRDTADTTTAHDKLTGDEWSALLIAIGEVFKAHGTEAINYANMLTGRAKKGEWGKCNISPVMRSADLTAWWKWYQQQHPTVTLVKEPAKVFSAIVEWRKQSPGTNGHVMTTIPEKVFFRGAWLTRDALDSDGCINGVRPYWQLFYHPDTGEKIMHDGSYRWEATE